MKALIIDESFVDILMLEKLLAEADIKTEVLLPGSDVVSKVLSYLPDVILLDIQTHGVKVCQQILNNNNTKDIPVIVISSDTTKQTKKDAYTAGGVDYLTKPINPSQVLSAVKRYGNMGEIINLCKSLEKIKLDKMLVSLI